MNNNEMELHVSAILGKTQARAMCQNFLSHQKTNTRTGKVIIT